MRNNNHMLILMLQLTFWFAGSIVTRCYFSDKCLLTIEALSWRRLFYVFWGKRGKLPIWSGLTLRCALIILSMISLRNTQESLLTWLPSFNARGRGLWAAAATAAKIWGIMNQSVLDSIAYATIAPGDLWPREIFRGIVVLFLPVRNLVRWESREMKSKVNSHPILLWNDLLWEMIFLRRWKQEAKVEFDFVMLLFRRCNGDTRLNDKGISPSNRKLS